MAREKRSSFIVSYSGGRLFSLLHTCVAPLSPPPSILALLDVADVAGDRNVGDRCHHCSIRSAASDPSLAFGAVGLHHPHGDQRTHHRGPRQCECHVADVVANLEKVFQKFFKKFSLVYQSLSKIE